MVIQTEIQVRYPDCDQMGIVHHAVYPIWYEMGRMDFFDKCGFGYLKSRALGIDPAMVNLTLNYGAPIKFPQTVVLNTRCTLLQGKKIGFDYEIFSNGVEKPLATAKSFHIWVKNGSSINIEAEVQDMFRSYAALADIHDQEA